MDTSELEKLRNQIRTSMTTTEAIEALSKYIEHHPDDDEALTLRGMKYWSMERRAEAINDYHAAIALNPQSRAVQALNAANEILDFYNKDLFNP